MEDFFETSFMSEAVENKPFADTPAQNFFKMWCKANDDSLIPRFIKREEWDKIGDQGIFKKNDRGKTLLLPEDLHLWEMMQVIKAVDHDTLARNPKKREERANKIRELGVTFEKAGIYLSEYLPELKNDQEKKIANDIANEFYNYGLLLQLKKLNPNHTHDSYVLSPEDKAKLDEWFLGRDVYQKRLARLGVNRTEKNIEETRKKLFSAYFKALGRKGNEASVEETLETEVGPMQHLQDITKRQITKVVETPEREMKTAIFRIGLEKLVTEMKEVGWRKAINDLLKKVGFKPILEQRRLYDTLQIDTLKQELETVRQTGNIAQISVKELEIARKIQKAVSSFPYKSSNQSLDESPNHPSKMVETQFINCVGSSILGGALFDEVGIKYLHAGLPEHSATVLITSDGKLYLQDLTPGGRFYNYKKIMDQDITGKNKNGNPLTTADIVAFANNPTDEGIRFEINRWWYNLYMGKRMSNRFIGLFKPEVGLQCHILNNTGNAFLKLGRNEEAIEAYKQAINVDPKDANTYYGLGVALLNLNRNEEAIEACKQAINVDPKDANPYCGLGVALLNLNRNEEAIEACKQAINVDPKDAYPYYGLGKAYRALRRNEEAIEAYRQFIKLWKGDKNLIITTNIIIKDIQKQE